MSRLEDQLRTALRDVADDIEVAPDAWQRNQARIVVARTARRGRIVAIAASVVAVLLVTTGVVVAVRTGSPEGAPPASGGPATDGAFADENLLGAPVDLGPIDVDGEPATWRAALTDETGDGPALCDEWTGSSSAAGGCASLEEGAFDRSVAIDWFMASRNGQLRTVVAGFDGRVATVHIHHSDGEAVQVVLHDTGWEDTTLMGHATNGSSSVPQRLVAYDEDDRVLQTIDLQSRIGGNWLPERQACAGDGVAEYVPDGDSFPNAHVALGTNDAQLSVRVAPGSSSSACLSRFRGSAIAGWHHAGRLIVVVVAPEVEYVDLNGPPRGEPVQSLRSKRISGSMWNVIEFRSPADYEFAPNAELVAMDLHGNVLDREFVDQPLSP